MPNGVAVGRCRSSPPCAGIRPPRPSGIRWSPRSTGAGAAVVAGWPRGCGRGSRAGRRPGGRRRRRLVGRGPGLTPEGDDILGGAAIGLRALGPAAGLAAGRVDALAAALCPPDVRARTGALSATLLELAVARGGARAGPPAARGGRPRRGARRPAAAGGIHRWGDRGRDRAGGRVRGERHPCRVTREPSADPGASSQRPPADNVPGPAAPSHDPTPPPIRPPRRRPRRARPRRRRRVHRRRPDRRRRRPTPSPSRARLGSRRRAVAVRRARAGAGGLGRGRILRHYYTGTKLSVIKKRTVRVLLSGARTSAAVWSPTPWRAVGLRPNGRRTTPLQGRCRHTC